ncbi:MAG: helix-turn-helix domain-containing protein [Oscillospiraceae bacterium]|nr:helix-turn-helix domain-containing protein [Oscillospiraceae bacterium]
MFPQRLKSVRTEKGIQQKELAQAMGVTQGTIGNWESGIRAPRFDMLERIAEYFSVSTDYLLGREEGGNDLTILTRKLESIPDEDMELVLGSLNNTIDVFLKAKGLI